MASRIFVPSDTTARSLGADEVAIGIADIAARDGINIEITRNGSRGLYWLEPLVEVETDRGRLAFGPITEDRVPELIAGGRVPGDSHPLCLGLTEEIPYLEKQHRLTGARVGIIDPLSIEQYKEHRGFEGLVVALEMTGAEIVEAITESGLRGRGGAAFPTGIKWNTVLGAQADQKYIVCNADEGDSGTFVDRMIMESDPFVLIEGMTIAGLAVGATRGYVYLRVEYPQAIETMIRAVDLAKQAGYLGDDILGSGHTFEIEIREAAGAYICGEETSMLESLEGKRGLVRYRPPLPAIEGFLGKPTVVNNVISLASVPIILDLGPEYYQDFGVGRSRGTLTAQLAGNIKHGGLVELDFGVTLRELLYDFGGGSATGRPIKAVQAGGPLGAYIPESGFDVAMDYEALTERGAMLGHGGIVAFDDSVDLGAMARFSMEFCAVESCGKCTPCRVGSVRGVEVIDRMLAGEDAENNRLLLRDLCQTMVDGSLCALGGLAPYPVLSIMDHFPEEL